MDEKERARALGATLSQIEKQFGKGSVIRLGSQAVAPVPAVSTGSISVDHALGIGGFPRGRISEIFGPESSGKTTIALQLVAEAQKAGGMGPISTSNTRSIRCTPRNLAWTSIIFWSLSPITASRRSKSRMR